MRRSKGLREEWHTVLNLTPGEHVYKFVIEDDDGVAQWRHADDQPKLVDRCGQTNNWMIVEDQHAYELTPETVDTSSDDEGYSQEISVSYGEMLFASEPPMAPLQLLAPDYRPPASAAAVGDTHTAGGDRRLEAARPNFYELHEAPRSHVLSGELTHSLLEHVSWTIAMGGDEASPCGLSALRSPLPPPACFISAPDCAADGDAGSRTVGTVMDTYEEVTPLEVLNETIPHAHASALNERLPPLSPAIMMKSTLRFRDKLVTIEHLTLPR